MASAFFSDQLNEIYYAKGLAKQTRYVKQLYFQKKMNRPQKMPQVTQGKKNKPDSACIMRNWSC